MSEIYIDWSKAPEGTTHAYVEDHDDWVNGQPLNSFFWEKWDHKWMCGWDGLNWEKECLLRVLRKEFRVARPVVEETNTVKIKKLRDNATLPVRATATAAGYDICFAPEFGRKYYPGTVINTVKVARGEVIKLETGLAFELPPNMAMLVLPRSGLATKQKLRPANTPGLVDSDYRGELFVALENFGEKIQTIEPGDRIAQVVFINTLHPAFQEVTELSQTDRGKGGFGSTGVNNNE